MTSVHGKTRPIPMQLGHIDENGKITVLGPYVKKTQKKATVAKDKVAKQPKPNVQKAQQPTHHKKPSLSGAFAKTSRRPIPVAFAQINEKGVVETLKPL